LVVFLSACGGTENSGRVSPEDTGGSGGVPGNPEGTTGGSGGAPKDIDRPPPLFPVWQTYLQITGVARGNGIYVAVGSDMDDYEDPTPSGVIYTSPDGFTWTPSTVTLPSPVVDVAYGNGIFVAIAQSSPALAYSSEDGKSWTPAEIPGAGPSTNQALAFGNGTFVASLGDRIGRSLDGKSWAFVPVANPNVIEFGAGTFVVWNGTHFESSKSGADWLASDPIVGSVQYGSVRLFGSAAGFDGIMGYHCCFGEVPPTYATIRSGDGATWKLDEGTPTAVVLQEASVCITFSQYPSYGAGGGSFSAGSSCSAANTIATDHGFAPTLVHHDGPAYLLTGTAGIYSSRDGVQFEPTLIHSKKFE
jgi:hypothetical protein